MNNPTPHRKAVILAIGDELILGQRPDTNSRWLAARLTDLGVVPVRFAVIPDDLDQLAAAFCQAIAESDLVISTGGLGPTEDDLTRAALAKALGDDLIEDASALADIEAFFKRAGRCMPPSNRLQALRPKNSRCLSNDNGTAPGLHAVASPRADVFCLPGPPSEMTPMFDRSVRPAIRAIASIRTAALHTVGLGESDVAARIDDLMHRRRNPLVGTTASGGIVTCRVRAEGNADIEPTLQELRRRLGPILFAEGDTTLPRAILDLLTQRGQTLATVESCTGGLIGSDLTGVAGSSGVYRGGWVTYSNELKRSQVGVSPEILADHGAVSEPCALAMARGGRRVADADWSIAVTGIAGPGGAVTTPGHEKPVGTVWIAIAGRDVSHARLFHFAGSRDVVRQLAATSALALLRLALIDQLSLPLLRQAPR